MQELMKSELEQVSGGCCLLSLLDCLLNIQPLSCVKTPSSSCGSTPPVVVPPAGSGSTGG